MRMIEADKVIPLVRLLLMFHPNAERIIEDMQAVVDSHTIEAEPVRHGRDCEHCLINLKWNTALCMRTVFRQSVPLDGFCNFGERMKGR